MVRFISATRSGVLIVTKNMTTLKIRNGLMRHLEVHSHVSSQIMTLITKLPVRNVKKNLLLMVLDIKMIQLGDIVLHTISGLYYRCENSKMERWMNMNPYYQVASESDVPESYFKKHA